MGWGQSGVSMEEGNIRECGHRGGSINGMID